MARKQIASLGLAAALFIGGGSLLGCDDEPDTPGEAVDRAADKVGDAVEKVGDKVEDAADETKDAVKDATN